MDERLNEAPCGYLSLADNGAILEINETLLQILGYEKQELLQQSVNTILGAPARLFYQMYFFPLIRLHGKVEEMYISLQSKENTPVPVLLNALRREYEGQTVNDCIFIPMKKRYLYEQELLLAKKTAQEAEQEKTKMIADLEVLKKDLEEKQRELLLLNSQLTILATTDELTGLQNRRSFQQDLSKNMSLFARLSQSLSLLLLDIDHFKQINDTYGHDKGDKVLQALAKLLQENCRYSDTIARYGGEEFVIVLPGIGEYEAILAAERLCSIVRQSQLETITVTISVGVATMIEGDTESTLLSRADMALYTSKNNGRNQVTHASSLSPQ